MRKPYKYDPEDIESLMLNKSFDELYDAEKKFVLRHLESESEYEEMRASLLAVKTNITNEQELVSPPPKIKEDLVDQFNYLYTKPKFSFLYSLNQLFAARPFYRNPVVQFAFATMIIISTVITIRIANQPTIADFAKVEQEIETKNEELVESRSPEPVKVDPIEEETGTVEENIEIAKVENLNKEFKDNEDGTFSFMDGDGISSEKSLTESNRYAEKFNWDFSEMENEKVEEEETVEAFEYQPEADKEIAYKAPIKTKETKAVGKIKRETIVTTDVNTVETISARKAVPGIAYKNKKKKEKLNVSSRTLAQDEDLFKLLYTAL